MMEVVGPRSEETKLKISKSKKGIKLSKETCQKISIAKKGCKIWSKGKKFTLEHINNIKKAKNKKYE